MNKYAMNSQLVIPIAIIVLTGIVFAIIFLDKKEFEQQSKKDIPKKTLSDTGEGEK